MDENFQIFSDFSKKTIKATSIVVLMGLLTFLFLKGFKVVLLILAGILISIFFHGIASFIERKIPMKRGLSLAITIVFFLSSFVLMTAILYPRISTQLVTLENDLPSAISKAEVELQQTQLGNWVIVEAKKYRLKINKDNEQLNSFFSTFFGGLTDFYIVFFLGLFLMINPNQYKNGLITLFPKHKRKRANEVLLTLGFTLKRWLMGKLFSMFIVGLFTVIGLTILDIPLALTLGLFAALITFIPNFGPLLALVPALLFAFTKGTDAVVYTLILYGIIQTIESNIITPLIQKKMIEFPIAMILIAQVVLGLFSGALGLMLAVPFIAIIMVIVKMVYVEDILGDRSIEVKGEDLFTN